MFEAIGIAVTIIVVGLAIRWYGYSHYYKAGRETRKQFAYKDYAVLRRNQERVLRDRNAMSFDRAFTRGLCLKSKDFKEVFRWRH